MKHQKLLITLSILFITVALILAFFVVYTGIYYKADASAIEAFDYSGFETVTLDDGTIALVPNASYDTGIIFYPGGKVEYIAYLPLMQCLASQGVLCLLTDMPFNLAVLDINRADGLRDGYKQVESWYMAGHSLGGSMACSYVADKASEFDGVILLASYSTEDLSQTGLSVLSIYGSNDRVLNSVSYTENKSNLPQGTVEYIIEGGNHAYFGTYGEQDGDGAATVTNREQIEITAEQIIKFIG